jgi:hypothetical protein
MKQQYVEKQLTVLNNRVKFLSSVLNGDIMIMKKLYHLNDWLYLK